MDLYLAQHGKATPKEEDPDRPLTREGRSETERVGRAAARSGIRLGAVWHSGKPRARETAEVFSQALLPAVGPEEKPWLGPEDDPRHAIEAARATDGPVLLVGHLPYMSRLPSLLLTGDRERGIVDVRYSGIIALGEDGDGWTLRWYMRPELLTG